ncbi:serine hydrolase [Pseudokineococcus sp. 1T1Z-3]|uniref:serine hydrolase n=1 Tax=Pseudokineococcus sp. 1T1Z-3 TaxID=3132745 RepID=UPI003098727C
MLAPRRALLTAVGAALVAGLTGGPAAASEPGAGPASSSTASWTGGSTAIPSATPVPGAGRLDVAPLQALVDEAAADDVRLSVGVESLDGATLTDGPVVLGSTEAYSSASLVKVALVVAALRAVDRGDLTLDTPVTVTDADDVGGAGVVAGYRSPYEATVAELAELAITVSDNTASNVLAEEVGLPEVQRLVDDLDLEPTHLGRLFMSSGGGGARNEIDTASTLELFRAVYEDDVLKASSRGLLLGWLRGQQLDTKFAPVLPGVDLASKTGDTSSVSHDAAYLLDPGRETVLVVLSETEDGRSPTAAADPYLARVAAEVGAQVAAAAAPTPAVVPGETETVADTVRETLAGQEDPSGSALPALGVVALGVLALLALAVVALRARVLLRRRRRARR